MTHFIQIRKKKASKSKPAQLYKSNPPKPHHIYPKTTTTPTLAPSPSQLSWLWSNPMPPPPLPSQPSVQTPLTPTFCYTSSLRTFLRQSRALLDDPISQQLSAYASETASRGSIRVSGAPDSSHRGRIASSSRLGENTCAEFISRVLMPEWDERGRVLEYCAKVAEEENRSALAASAGLMPVAPSVDARLDPYSSRVERKESRGEILARQVAEEKRVEEIVKARSWEVLKSRCSGVGERVER